ncbi:MAG: outer membrane beta-barrel protein [Caulobacterales bacterium]|uniref:outer membrane beta-barrel protein n=1 Tax=Glycocaulis sp. TaxID=1969725 RepID=UPI003FA14A16
MVDLKEKLFSSVGAAVLILGAGGAASVAGASTAEAQALWDRDRNVSVTQRPRPEYDALGARAGAFIYRPSLTLGVELNDNIFATATNEETDSILILNPAVTVDTTWSRHAFNAYANVNRKLYNDFTDESTTDYALGAGGRLDIRRSTSLNGSISQSRGTEPRTSAGAAGFAAEPIRFDNKTFSIGGQHTFNRLRLRAGYDFAETDYEDARLIGGGVASQDFRDQDTHRYTVRADYAISPDTALFVRYRYNDRDFHLAPPAVLNNRDSDGYTIDGGVEFDLGGLARGEIGLGYTEQTYVSAAFPKVEGFSFDGLVEWFPTQLTTLTFTARRAIEDSGIAASAGFLGTSLAAQLDHELLRNVILTGRVDYANDDYEGIDREDERWGATAQATYLVNRNLGLTASYSYLDQTSAGIDAANAFSVNRVMFSAVIQY